MSAGAAGQVVSVGRDGEHRFSKPPCASITLLTGLGVDGDAHAGTTVQHMPPAGTSPEVLVESVTDHDAGELLTLQRAAYLSEARLYGDLDLPPLVQTLEELRDELASGHALKAVAGHRIVGAVRAVATGAVLQVARLTVAPDWQGRGIGSLLLAEVEDRRPADVRSVTLFTGHLSAANLGMYARRGYREERRERLTPDVVLVHLVKPLPQRVERAATTP